MVSRKERLQRIWHQYDSRRDHKPSSMRQAAAWAVADGLLQLPEVDPIDNSGRPDGPSSSGRVQKRLGRTALSCKPCRPSHKEWAAVHVLGCHGLRASEELMRLHFRRHVA